jgi:hypothetical protein
MKQRRPRPATHKEITIPPPIGGLNTVDPAFSMSDAFCPMLFNMLGDNNGLEVRLGYTEWCTGVGVGIVPTVMPFFGSDASKNRLFATSSAKIYDVTASSATPTSKLTFGSSAGDAGWGVCAAAVNAANAHFLLYADEQNGYHVYSESGTLGLVADSWNDIAQGAGAAQINSVNPDNISFVTVWKNIVLFVEKNTSKMWFATSSGAAVANVIFENSGGGGTFTKFDFGAKFAHGGYLVGLWSCTVDGGNGMDDYLIAISSGGDVLVYQGTDPANAAAFSIKGQFYVGGVPAGRRIATPFGGDTLILSSLGIFPISHLVLGTDIADHSLYSTDKISNLVSRLIATYGTLKGWSLHIHPEQNALIVTVPIADGQPTVQLAMGFRSKGWSQYRNLPILSGAGWGVPGKFYFGTADGRLCINTGYVDNVPLAANDYTPIQFAGITAFKKGRPTQKMIQVIRPILTSEGATPTIQCEARYKYDLTEVAAPGTPGTPATNTWDVGLWDVALWGGDAVVTEPIFGASGMGPEASVAWKGSTTARTVLLGFDVLYLEGNAL